jgi:hypothetical protein
MSRTEIADGLDDEELPAPLPCKVCFLTKKPLIDPLDSSGRFFFKYCSATLSS